MGFGKHRRLEVLLVLLPLLGCIWFFGEVEGCMQCKVQFKLLVKIVWASFGSMLSKLKSANGFCLSCSAGEMMMFLSSAPILILELLFDHVFMGGRRWVCSREFVGIYKKHFWLKASVFHEFLLPSHVFLGLVYGREQSHLKIMLVSWEWVQLASEVKNKSFSVLSQWKQLSSHTRAKLYWLQCWETHANDCKHLSSVQVVWCWHSAFVLC